MLIASWLSQSVMNAVKTVKILLLDRHLLQGSKGASIKLPIVGILCAILPKCLAYSTCIAACL